MADADPGNAVGGGGGNRDQPPPARDGEEGAGRPRNDDPVLYRAWYALANNVEMATLSVFIIVSLSFILVIPLAIITFYIDTDVASFLIRAADLLLKLAAVSVIFTLIIKQLSAWAVVLGFVVISALIVPVDDLLRITLIFSESEKRFSDFYVAPTQNRIRPSRRPAMKDAVAGFNGLGLTSDPRTSNHSDFSHRLLDQLEEAGIAGSEGVPPGHRREAVLDIIDEAHIDLQLSDAALQVVSSGAVETYRAVVVGKVREVASLQESDDRFRRYMAFLRAEGIIDYPLSDFSSAHATRFGCDLKDYVLGLPFDDAEEAAFNDACPPESVGARRGYSEPFQITRPPDDNAQITSLGRFSGRDTLSRSIRLRNEIGWYSFYTEVGGDVSIVVNPNDREGDPVVGLYNESRQYLREDDDNSSPTTNRGSLIRLLVEPNKTYILGVREYDQLGPQETAATIEIAAGRGSEFETGPPEGANIRGLGTINGNIDLRSERTEISRTAWFAFEISESRVVTIEAITDSQGDPEIVLYGPDRRERLAYNDDTEPDTRNSLIHQELVESGTYFVGVRGVDGLSVPQVSVRVRYGTFPRTRENATTPNQG